MDKLKPDDRAFVKEYMTNGNNATQALIKTKKGKKYKKGSDRVTAHKKLTSANIQKAILSIADAIPDKLIIKKHLALLNKEEVITKNNMTTGEIDTIPTGEIDVQAVSKGLDMVYKLKGAYKDDPQKPLNLIVPILVKFIDKKEDEPNNNTDTD